MRKLLSLLWQPLLFVLLALLVLSVLIWWMGPLVRIGALAPLASELARALLIGALVLLVLGRYLWRRWRARSASRQLAEELVKPEPVPATALPDAAAEEQKLLAERFAEAIQTLRKMRLQQAGGKPGWRDWLSISGGSYLYELPWYVFIGAPGSGKTTALVNSGLSFPLAEKYGAAAVRGIGGTRDCEWWFTDQAVLIDTAGRYTTQDSQADTDRAAWDNFLAGLKRARPRRPLNGVILTVSVADLLHQGADSRAALATAMRLRLQELDGKLSTRLPVYVLVTKADLLNGFMEYFDDLGKEQRSQVFGFTLGADEGDGLAEKGVGAFLPREFKLLHQRLNDGLIDRLQHELDPRRRSAIFTFPAQFASLEARLGELLDQVFVGSKFARAPWCAASTSPAARRRAARSTASWARCRATSASSARCRHRRATAAAATSSPRCSRRWCFRSSGWPAPTSSSSAASTCCAARRWRRWRWSPSRCWRPGATAPGATSATWNWSMPRSGRHARRCRRCRPRRRTSSPRRRCCARCATSGRTPGTGRANRS